MHSNLHHEQIDQLPLWLEHAKANMDFWPIAYYPFHMRKLENGFAVEDVHEKDVRDKDWQIIAKTCEKENQSGFAMFMGYEWQGNGKDGDHNVYFLHNDEKQEHPMTYEELKEIYRNKDAIAIAHHVAYQLGSRGKNWDSQDDEFTPFAEIYSSHGLSENDHSSIPMNRHVHMGPRVSNTSYERGLEKGHIVGCIASGDNHIVPGTYGYGMMCVLSKDRSKEAIWDALKKRRVYGVSHSRIKVDYAIDDHMMGSVMACHGKHILNAHIEGSGRIEEIRILKNNELYKMILPKSKESEEDIVTFKVRVEFGWGPDIRVFPLETKKNWKGRFFCKNGKIISVEKCFSNFHQKVSQIKEDEVCFDLTTYQTNGSGKWMGACVAANESLIFEVSAPKDGEVLLELEEKRYCLKISDLLHDSLILADMEEADALIRRHFGKVEHYRNDPWWHNSYKIKIHQACLKKDYVTDVKEEIQADETCQYRLIIRQENGDMAWTSPIFMKNE